MIINNIIAQTQTPTACLITKGLITNNCNPVGDPFIDNTCFAGIQKQIARSVNADGIIEWNTHWEDIGNFNCIAPYDTEWERFCPDVYCEQIKTFVDLKASLIVRAAGTWNDASRMKKSSRYYEKMEQLIFDINKSYDCAGLRRPVVQGAIYENIDASVNEIEIPSKVINAFRFENGFDNNYYLDPYGNPKNINFKFNNIKFNNNSCPDITKIEAKMWFLYLAQIYIDIGFKSIHMGQMDMWAKSDYSFYHTQIILNKIRNYASSKNTFVLLTQEDGKALKFPNSDIFMYDYDSRVLWPTEIPSKGSSVACNSSPINYLNNSPCANETFKAVIDKCVIEQLGNENGYSPLNGCYLPKMPFNTYFDFGEGDHPPLGIATNSPEQSVWGWDDTKWFGQKISSPCREFWMGDAICRLRSFYQENGFMIAPGALIIKNKDSLSNNIPDGAYLLYDEQNVKDEIITKWTPNKNTGINYDMPYPISPITINEPGNPSSYNPNLRNCLYIISVDNPDCTTVYTWHIQNPNGSWQPFTFGTERKFMPPENGWYKISLRQDNLGSFEDNIFSDIKTIHDSVYLYKKWCESEFVYLNSYNKPNHQDFKIGLEVNLDFEEYIDNKMYFYADEIQSEYELRDEFDKEIQIYIYPNPVIFELNIKTNLQSSQGFNIFVYNSLGQMCKSYYITDILNETINVEDLYSGIYFIKIQNLDNNKSYNAKFIKK